MDNLERQIQKRFQTAFIAPIAQIEEHFGVLWGHKRFPETMTTTEHHWWTVFQTVRTNILNTGNNQLRSILQGLQDKNER